MKYKFLFFILSILIILPGIYFLIIGGLKPGIDFTGGALLEYRFHGASDSAQLQPPTLDNLSEFGTVAPEKDNTFLLRTKSLDPTELATLKANIAAKVGRFEVVREENIGPVIGKELKDKAIFGITLACIMIVLYITYAFRKVPKPASSWRFGISAVVALVHDVLVLLGVFAIFGKFFHTEVDTLFVTALLTVVGFSVHDTIVVFDRIRENMPRHLGKKFSDIADISITQTLARSLNTSITVVIVLVSLLLFGGETIRWFVIALLIGVISGTYSSIFNATALLAWWEEKLGH